MPRFGDNPIAETGTAAAQAQGQGPRFGDNPISAPVAALNEMDRETGAPWQVRLAAAQAPTPEDALAVVRQQFPDAQWMEFGGRSGTGFSRQTGAEYQKEAEAPMRHIVYTNPETGRPTTLNARGLDWGDVVETLPEWTRVGAYAAGAAGGAALSGGNPAAMAGGGTAASQAFKYLTDPVVEFVTGLKIPDTRSTGEKVREGAADLGLELAGGFGGEISGMALRKVKGVPYAYERRAILKSVPKGQGRPGVVQGLEQMAEAQGVPKGEALAGALPLATRGDTVRGFFQAAAKYPRSAETIQQALEKTQGVLTREFERIQRGVGTGARERGTGGQGVKWGLKDYAQKTAADQKALEEALEKAIGGKTRTPMANTVEMIEAELAKVPQGAKPGGGVVPGDYLDLIKTIEANGGELPFEYVRAFRESIGEATSGGLIAPTGAKTKWYDPLYGALTRDMEAIAKQAGRKAENAFARTQSNWAQRETRLELLRTVANSKTAEDAFRAAMSGAKDGPSKLTALRASVPQDAWDDLVAVKLWEMGTVSRGAATGDEVGKVFSPTQFIGNWREMSDQSKAVLFPPGTRLRGELDRLAKVTAAASEGGRAMINPSGTAQANVFMEMLGEGAMSDMLTGGKVGMIRGVGRAMNPLSKARRANRQALLMTDPDFVKWLADGTQIPPKPASVANHLTRLAGGAFAAKSPPVKRALSEYLDEWQRSTAEAQQEPGAEPPK